MFGFSTPFRISKKNINMHSFFHNRHGYIFHSFKSSISNTDKYNFYIARRILSSYFLPLRYYFHKQLSKTKHWYLFYRPEVCAVCMFYECISLIILQVPIKTKFFVIKTELWFSQKTSYCYFFLFFGVGRRITFFWYSHAPKLTVA